jgi:hypothetical protein
MDLPRHLLFVVLALACSTSGGSIQVVSASFGANCTPRPADGTQHLAGSCNGKDRCQYTVDHKVIGDPKKWCTKSYVAQWRCGSDPTVHRLEVLESHEVPYTVVAELRCR